MSLPTFATILFLVAVFAAILYAVWRAMRHTGSSSARRTGRRGYTTGYVD